MFGTLCTAAASMATEAAGAARQAAVAPSSLGACTDQVLVRIYLILLKYVYILHK